ncbi:MAG: hypothetical protein IK090_05605 [Clostridia bacterium]|nr:hypothetical protein [Clostridia bacterium]
MKREDLPAALYVVMQKMGGAGTLLDICKEFWKQFETDLRQSGDLFYTWQYDIRWAATTLRKLGKMEDTSNCAKGIWKII